MLLAALGYGSSSVAIAETPPDRVMDFDAGMVCEFPLRVEIWNEKDFKEFKDKNGFVRSLSAGSGTTLRLTNIEFGRTLTLKPKGYAQHITTNKLDGSFVQTNTGHTVLFLFPTDIPAGPSTTLYVGKVTFTSDAAYNFTVTETSGTKTDLCAALN
jgi:hypothetical protein